MWIIVVSNLENLPSQALLFSFNRCIYSRCFSWLPKSGTPHLTRHPHGSAAEDLYWSMGAEVLNSDVNFFAVLWGVFGGIHSENPSFKQDSISWWRFFWPHVINCNGVATMDLWQSLEYTWDAESSWFVFIQIPFPSCDITSMRDLPNSWNQYNIFQTRFLRWSWLWEGTCDAENHGRHDPKLSWDFPGWFLIQIFGDVRRT
jgi:hypothetical protein